MITIGNIAQNLKFQNTLKIADFIVKQSTKRLSTGYRINSAADDPSGFVIAAGLTRQIRGTEIANQNSLMAKNYIKLADTATVSMLDNAYSMKDLAAQALATTDSAKRAELQTLANKFLEQMYGTQSSAKFGEQKIFEDVESKAIITEEEARAQGYTIIKTAAELQNIATGNLNGKYILMNDIDLSSIENFDSIGTDYSGTFTGTFDGNGFSIRNLSVNKYDDYQGLFGYTEGATIKNVKLENVNVKGENGNIGGLVGYASNSTITNCSVSGNVAGSYNTGGLVGYSDYGTTISNCSTSGNVTGYSYTGGLVGGSYGDIKNCFSTANVTATSGAYGTGGLVGVLYGTISNSYATGTVKGESRSGGFIGSFDGGTVTNSYAAGNVIGTDEVGGFSGHFCGGGITVTNSYATGNVTGTNQTGGFVGSTDGGTVTLNNCFSAGQNLSTVGTRGGFIGYLETYASITFTNSSFVTQNNGISASGSGSVTGITQRAATYFTPAVKQSTLSTGVGANQWDFSGSTPQLKWQITPPPAPQSKPITFQTGYDTSSTSRLDMDMALNVGGLVIDFSSDAAIKKTMDAIDAVSKKLENKSAYFAAHQSILDNTISYQELSYTNLTEARGRIVDTNVADELYRFAKAQIVAETTSSLMQQCANLNASIVMKLIGVV